VNRFRGDIKPETGAFEEHEERAVKAACRIGGRRRAWPPSARNLAFGRG
jgi:hypothetical protein